MSRKRLKIPDLCELSSWWLQLYNYCTLFAVDANLHLSHKDIKTSQTYVKNELDKVDISTKSNTLSINCSKTAYMILKQQPVLQT